MGKICGALTKIVIERNNNLTALNDQCYFDAPFSSIAEEELNKTLEEMAICRICYDEVTEQEKIRPCECSGSIANVHKACLDQWLDHKYTPRCEICHSNYSPNIVNYKWWRVWNHPWIEQALRLEAVHLYMSAVLHIARFGHILCNDIWITIVLSTLTMAITIGALVLSLLMINFVRYIMWKMNWSNHHRIIVTTGRQSQIQR